MAPLVGLGIGFITDLVSKYGEKLAVRGIEKATGIDLSKQEITPEIQQMLLDNEIKIRALDFEKLKLETESKLENKRLDIQNTSNAQAMNTEIQKSEFASNLAKNTAYYIDIALVLAVIALGFSLFVFKLPIENKELAYTMFGSLLTMAGTVINFHRGSSKGSIDKQDIINKMNGAVNENK